MNLRYKTLLKAKLSDNEELWARYRSLRNRVTHDVRVAKCKFYVDLFDEVKDSKSYWKFVKKAASSSASQPILGIRTSQGQLKHLVTRKRRSLTNTFLLSVKSWQTIFLPVARRVVIFTLTAFLHA